jgi:hypothetical protein
MTDPFASASGAVASKPAGDPFAQPPKSSFPNMDALFGRLILARPTLIEKVPNKFDQDGEKVDRVTVDVTVLDGGPIMGNDTPHTFSGMYISQGSLVGQLKGFIATRGMVLGRMVRVARKKEQEKYGDTPEAMERVLAEWLANGARGQKPSFAWRLADFTEGDANIARQFLATTAQAA